MNTVFASLVRSRFVVCTMAIVLSGIAGEPLFGDWPQINGPNRNGVAVNETLLMQWPKQLNQIWSHPVGGGYSGPAIAKDRVILFHRPAKSYLVECLDAATGKLIWNKSLPAEFAGGMDGDKGPKAVPLIHDDHVYVIGADGLLFCLKFDDGEPVWQKNLLKDYDAQPGYFGVGSSPIAIGENLICNVGGKDAGIVAFDLKTGKETWKAFDDRASYSSPIELVKNDQKIAVFFTRVNLVGLDATSGEVIFESPFGKKGPTVNGAMPVYFTIGDAKYLFGTAAYRVGAKLWKTDGASVESVWANDTSYSSQFSTPVIFKGSLFGTSGRHDFKNGAFTCVDVLTGKPHWSQAGITVGHSLLVDDKVLLFDTDGGLHVIEADKSKFRRVFQTQLFDSTSFAMPALSNGLLYARSNAGRSGNGELVCVQVGKRVDVK